MSPIVSPTGNWVGVTLFVLLFLAGVGIFAVRAGELVMLLIKARPEDRTDHLDDRIGEFFKVVLGQSGVLRDPIPGIAHFLTFWGFIIIQIGLLDLLIRAFGFEIPFIGGNPGFVATLDVFIILVAVALVAQRLALRGRSFAVLSGRTRPAPRIRLSWCRQVLALCWTGGFFVLALGVPAFGAAAASLLPSGGGVDPSALTLGNFRHVLSSGDLLSGLGYSARLAALVACVAVAFGAVAGRALARHGADRTSRALDMLLLAAVALPSILLASGYIFTYNLPVTSELGLDLYGTTTLLVIGYLAGALPSAARLLSGSLGQVNDSLLWAARVHGRPAVPAWRGAVLPLVAGALTWTWLIAFCGTLLELPVSQLLAPPGQSPLSVAITHHLQGYDLGGGAAMTVLVVAGTLALIGIALAALRRLLPDAHRLEAV